MTTTQTISPQLEERLKVAGSVAGKLRCYHVGVRPVCRTAKGFPLYPRDGFPLGGRHGKVTAPIRTQPRIENAFSQNDTIGEYPGQLYMLTPDQARDAKISASTWVVRKRKRSTEQRPDGSVREPDWFRVECFKIDANYRPTEEDEAADPYVYVAEWPQGPKVYPHQIPGPSAEIDVGEVTDEEWAQFLDMTKTSAQIEEARHEARRDNALAREAVSPAPRMAASPEPTAGKKGGRRK